MALSQAEAARLLTEYLDELDDAQKDGPLRFRRVFDEPPPGVGVHEIDAQMCVLRVNPDIARALRDEERAVFKDLKQSLGREIAVKPDVQLHHEQFDLMAIG